MVTHIAIAELDPHPCNPRLSPRADVVEQIAAQIVNGMDDAHALLVRPVGGGYQILSGHHRWLAAQQAGLSHVPCWVRELSDDDAYMQLLLCNTQSELHPLEEGKHAAESGLDLKAYAERAGKAHTTMKYKAMAYRVACESHVRLDDLRDSWRCLAEIHAAPRWAWAALASVSVERSWTVEQTRKHVSAFKDAPEADSTLFDLDGIATAIVGGVMCVTDIGRMIATIDSARVRDEEPERFRLQMMGIFRSERPSRLSHIQSIIGRFETLQTELDSAKRAAETEAARRAEQAAERVSRLRQNCSLDEWKGLEEEERRILLEPAPGISATFNKQENDSIEWAQWSWNPVTGCRHDCPYCYARDIALSKRMEKAYPNGFEPTFRSNALTAPGAMKVPHEAAHDTRFRNVFTCSMADLFGRWVPAEWINAVLSTVRNNPQWNFLFLTKFPKRMAEFDIPENAWMGTTVDLQVRVKNAEDAFARVKSGVRWLSIEPMLEQLHFDHIDRFDWVVIGGASRSTKTPSWNPPFEWVRDIVEQCRNAGVRVYFKTNLFGDNSRLLELPFDAPIASGMISAPSEFEYLKPHEQTQRSSAG